MSSDISYLGQVSDPNFLSLIVILPCKLFIMILKQFLVLTLVVKENDNFKTKLFKNGAAPSGVSSLILIDKSLTNSKDLKVCSYLFIKIKIRFLVNFEVYFEILEHAPAGVNILLFDRLTLSRNNYLIAGKNGCHGNVNLVTDIS